MMPSWMHSYSVRIQSVICDALCAGEWGCGDGEMNVCRLQYWVFFVGSKKHWLAWQIHVELQPEQTPESIWQVWSRWWNFHQCPSTWGCFPCTRVVFLGPYAKFTPYIDRHLIYLFHHLCAHVWDFVWGNQKTLFVGDGTKTPVFETETLLYRLWALRAQRRGTVLWFEKKNMMFVLTLISITFHSSKLYCI